MSRCATLNSTRRRYIANKPCPAMRGTTTSSLANPTRTRSSNGSTEPIATKCSTLTCSTAWQRCARSPTTGYEPTTRNDRTGALDGYHRHGSGDGYDARYLIFRCIAHCVFAVRASPMIEFTPSEGGPNSIRPLNPTTFSEPRIWASLNQFFVQRPRYAVLYSNSCAPARPAECAGVEARLPRSRLHWWR